MALTIRISNVDDVIAAFAKNDIMISHMTKLRAAEGEFTKGMAPGDDYYTSPFAVSSGWTRKTASRPKAQVIQICFTAYKCREAHDVAIHAMGDLGRGMRALGSMVEVEDALYNPKQIVKFRRSPWAGGDDVSLDLEDRAMKITCNFLDVTVPPDWRARREAIVKEHAVWALHKLPQTAEIGPDDKEPCEKPLQLTKCGCGNYASGTAPNGNLCNGCTALLAKEQLGGIVG